LIVFIILQSSDNQAILHKKGCFDLFETAFFACIA